jgi:hypothetical protein
MSDATNQTNTNQPAKAEVIPPDLGDELETARSAHEKVIKALGNGCAAAIEAGEALNRIKAVVSKGEFMDYVEGVCHIPGRTGRWYMQLANEKPQLEQALKAGGKGLATCSRARNHHRTRRVDPSQSTSPRGGLLWPDLAPSAFGFGGAFSAPPNEKGGRDGLP